MHNPFLIFLYFVGILKLVAQLNIDEGRVLRMLNRTTQRTAMSTRGPASITSTLSVQT